MKKLPFLLGLFLVLPLLMMCEKEEDINSITISDKSISQDDFVLKLKGEEVKLDNEIKELFLNNINKKFKIKADNINSITIEQTNNPDFNQKNLIFELSNSSGEKMSTVAIVLQQNSLKGNGKAIGFFATESHSCAGAPCGCCVFNYSSSGNIIGCKCNGSNQRGSTCPYQSDQGCNHTITSN